MHFLPTLEELRDTYGNCGLCPLSQTRNKVCLGEGNPHADIMLIGEGPGRHEDTRGRPFIGDSGALLNMIFADINKTLHIDSRLDVDDLSGISSDEHKKLADVLRDRLYITNTVMCYRNDPKPTPVEVDTCRERLLNEIYLVDPLVIITLGGIAINGLLKTNTRNKVSIKVDRGDMYTLTFQGAIGEVKYPVMAALHPAFLMRVADAGKKDGYYERTKRDIMRIVKAGTQYSDILDGAD